MRVKAAIRGDLRRVMASELKSAERAVTRGVGQATDGLKAELRAQVATAGFGGRLARTWRGRVYPNKGIDAAGMVWSKAPGIVRAFAEGAVIRGRKGRYLAIPTPAAPRRGTDGKRITPATFPVNRFGRLRFVPRRSGPALLVADGMVARGGRRGGFRKATVRKGGKSRGAFVSLRGLATVVMFVLVPQVRLRKRLDPVRAGRRWQERLPGLIVGSWRDG